MMLTALVIVAIIVHVKWFIKKRSSKFPAIGTKWCYSTYMQRYVAEVIKHHPLTGELTILRVREGELRSNGSELRVNSTQFISSVTPYREKK